MSKNNAGNDLFQGAAGLWVSINRIFTKMLTKDLRVSTFSFFVISHLVVMTSCVLFQIVQSSDFVKFYIARSEESKKKISLEPTEEYVSYLDIFFVCHVSVMSHDISYRVSMHNALI